MYRTIKKIRGMKTPKTNRRDRLFRKHPFCHWCGRRLICPRSLTVNGRLPKGYVPNMATIDHIDSRLSPERGKHPGKVRTVLSCRKCNELRAAAEVERIGIEEERRRSGRGGWKHSDNHFRGFTKMVIT